MAFWYFADDDCRRSRQGLRKVATTTAAYCEGRLAKPPSAERQRNHPRRLFPPRAEANPRGRSARSGLAEAKRSEGYEGMAWAIGTYPAEACVTAISSTFIPPARGLDEIT